MNKDLIKKYKKEFDFMLEGGCCLLGRKDLTTNKWDWYDYGNSISQLFEKESSSSCLEFIVINDEYVEFRKALAEGETIQYQLVNTAGKASGIWTDVTEQSSSSCKSFDSESYIYRIKPDELEFKEGDWVRDISSKIVIKAYEDMRDQNFETWKPKKGEWCIFYNEESKDFVVAKFNKQDAHVRPYIASPSGRFEFCEPYQGYIPTNLKDK